MKEVKIPAKCPGCKESLFVRINLFTMKLLGIVMAKPPAKFGEKMRVIAHYKKLKGLDKITTWDGAYRGRALKAVGKILHLFRKLDDPIGVAIELITETEDRASAQQWSDWNLDTCAKRAGEWLAEKNKPRRNT